MAGVQYNDGAFYLLVLALLAMYMLPATGSFIYSEVTRPVYKAGPCDTAARRKANTPSLKRFNTFWSYVLIGCWVLFIGLLTLEGVITADEATFDPFAILEIEDTADESEIKKAYRKLSMIWHPDKNPEGSENFELAAEKFIQIAKAQDALLDPETKKNYEEYGNPDGRQTMSGSIGLPEFLMDESKWQLILLVYFGLLMFALPVMVWRWWSNTEQFAGTFKVYKLTLHHYANKVNEVTKLKQLPPILACCFEYTKIDVRASCSQDMDAILESESELKDLRDRIKKSKNFLDRYNGAGVAPNDKTKMEFVYANRGKLTKACILLHAWLVPTFDQWRRPELEEDMHDIIREAPRLLQALIEFCTQQARWLQPVLAALDLSQCIVQRICPWDPPRGRDLMQLPHFDSTHVRYCTTKNIKNTKQFLAKTTEERREILRKMSEEEFSHVETAIESIPHFDIEYQAFVKGDDEDVANILFDMCAAREEEINPSEKKEESSDEDDEWDDLRIPDDDDDEKPCYLPWKEIEKILTTAVAYDEKQELVSLGFTPKKIQDAKEEMGEELDLEKVDYAKFVKIAAKQVLKIHAMDLVTIRLDLKMHNPGTEDVHCPQFPARKRCAWYAILADPNHNQIMDFKRMGNISESKQEVRQLMWMPQKQGTYELEVHVKCDSYGGLDVRFPMKLDVLKKKEPVVPQYIEEESESDSSSSSSESDDDEYGSDSD